MRHEFYEIYRDVQDVYRAYSFPAAPFFATWHKRDWLRYGRTVRLVVEAIDEALVETEPSRPLRPDAKHFLLVNFHQMIVLPLVHPAAGEFSEDDIRQAIQDDVRLILRNALEEPGESEEVSGGAVVQAVAKTWSELRINSFEVWG